MYIHVDSIDKRYCLIYCQCVTCSDSPLLYYSYLYFSQVGDTPLHDSALMGHLDCVKFLVLKGADITQCNNVSGNGPVAHNVKYFNNMQIAHDVTSESFPNVWRPLEKALIISLHWCAEPFILFVCMQWKISESWSFSVLQAASNLLSSVKHVQRVLIQD